jgi:hypothetical protein
MAGLEQDKPFSMHEPAVPGFGRASLRELVVNGCYRMYLMDVHEFVQQCLGFSRF